ncbi:hypothetical protein ACHAXH_007123 [Discostella pseudostelligera]|jgi:translocator assembly and maintenance protein 41
MRHRRICTPIHHQFHRQPASKGKDQERQCLRFLTTAIPGPKSAAQISSNEELAAIVHQFAPGVDYAFGYGSGVFHQQPSSHLISQTNTVKSNVDEIATTTPPGMIDIILAVNDPLSWHKRNMERHSDHYSTLARWGGPHFVTQLQVNFGAKVYFHPFVNMSVNMSRTQSHHPHIIQREIKYGAVSTNDLVQDLLHWDYLYLAGRMHKPIVTIKSTSTDGVNGTNMERIDASATQYEMTHEVEVAQRSNLLSAVSASLLLQTSTSAQLITTSQLYNTIASLSYTGDFRMQTGAEDPSKIKKLVETPGMMERWDDVYLETLVNMQKLGVLNVVANDNPPYGADAIRCLEIGLMERSVRKQLMTNLPLRLQKHSDMIVGTNDSTESIQNGATVLRQELANIVSPAAKSQSIKGFVTAGVGKSWKYALAKFAKGRLRK